jgi:hypothetical protein
MDSGAAAEELVLDLDAEAYASLGLDSGSRMSGGTDKSK